MEGLLETAGERQISDESLLFATGDVGCLVTAVVVFDELFADEGSSFTEDELCLLLAF